MPWKEYEYKNFLNPSLKPFGVSSKKYDSNGKDTKLIHGDSSSHRFDYCTT
jgi:hypothetical protein